MEESRMKRSALISILLLFLTSSAIGDEARIVEVDVHGMACAFCVEGLRKTLTALPGVDKVTVSLKNNLARLELDPQNAPDPEAIKQAILDAGFTPGDVRELP
jgi:copper chaperone CopZ